MARESSLSLLFIDTYACVFLIIYVYIRIQVKHMSAHLRFFFFFFFFTPPFFSPIFKTYIHILYSFTVVTPTKRSEEEEKKKKGKLRTRLLRLKKKEREKKTDILDERASREGSKRRKQTTYPLSPPPLKPCPEEEKDGRRVFKKK